MCSLKQLGSFGVAGSLVINSPDRIHSQADLTEKMSSLGPKDYMDYNNMYSLTQYEEMLHSTAPR